MIESTGIEDDYTVDASVDEFADIDDFDLEEGLEGFSIVDGDSEPDDLV